MTGYHAIESALILLAHQVSHRYHTPSHSREDLEQEAILVLLQSLPRHDPRRHGSVEGYITNRIRAHLFRLVARERRQSALACEYAVSDISATSQREELAELAHLHLPARWAKVLELTASGTSDADIAQSIGSSVSVVQKMRCQGLARLRKIVQSR